MTPLRRLMSALLPLGLFALWLAPASSAAPVAPTAHTAQHATRSVALRAAPAASPVASLEAETTAEGTGLRRPATARPDDPRPPRHRAITPDEPTRARSAGPIYRVRRSGQAHRSAP